MVWNIAERVQRGQYVMLARREDGSYIASSPCGEYSGVLSKEEGEAYINRCEFIPTEIRANLLSDARTGFVLA